MEEMQKLDVLGGWITNIVGNVQGITSLQQFLGVTEFDLVDGVAAMTMMGMQEPRFNIFANQQKQKTHD
jgi:hypothetical protein